MFGWLRKFLGRGEGQHRPRRVRSRVEVESHHRVRPEVLRALRALDDNLDVFVLPDGRVWMLHFEPGKERIRVARQSLYTAKKEQIADEPMFSERLALQGFCRWSEDPFAHGNSVGFMEARAQRLVYVTERELATEMRTRRAYADGTTQAIAIYNILSQRIRADAKFDQARVGRNAKQFGRAHASR